MEVQIAPGCGLREGTSRFHRMRTGPASATRSNRRQPGVSETDQAPGSRSPRTYIRLRASHRWILRRLLLGVAVVYVATLVIFFATHALPTDPAQAILGKDATPESLAVLRQQLGLNRALHRQYFEWLGGLLQGNLGTSLASGRPVSQMLDAAMVSSVSLLVLAAAFALPLSVLLGAITAVRRDRLVDRTLLLAALGLTALPEFVIGILLVIVFSTTVSHVLPAVALFPPGESVFQHPLQVVLPVLTLVLVAVPYLYRLLRASMIDVLESEYVTMARLKGLPERIVAMRHALPNALIPMIQASGLILSYLLGGIVTVEYLFHYPGLGSLLVDAITNRDVPLIEGVVLVFAVGVVLFNLTADILTVYLTPKLRIEAAR
jgi:peptide/nickel transport system permease protein